MEVDIFEAPQVHVQVLPASPEGEPKGMPKLPKGRRRSKRTKAVMPVRLWIADSQESYLAHTLDITARGVRLGGFQGEVKVGDKIYVQRQQKRAQFRVVWVSGRGGSSEKQLGAEILGNEAIWGVELPKQMDDYQEKE